MSVDADLLRSAVRAVASVEGLHMDPDHLVEDVFVLSRSFPDERDFQCAVASTVRAMTALVERRVGSSELRHGLSARRSYHYQHRVVQGARADCRIVFRYVDGGIEVRGFGHRHVPADVYERLARSRRASRGGPGA